jgi:glutamyl/glutaminyl-tRNA synthetase
MDSMHAILGQMKVGGGKKAKKSTTKKSMKSKNTVKKNLKSVKKMVRKVHKFNRPRYFGGQELKCTCEPLIQQQAPVVVQQQAEQAPIVQQTAPSASPTVGGGKMSIATYKKYLENLTTERLHKIASSKGVKITKKKDGKTVYVKKATIVKKLCEFKHKR